MERFTGLPKRRRTVELRPLAETLEERVCMSTMGRNLPARLLFHHNLMLAAQHALAVHHALATAFHPVQQHPLLSHPAQHQPIGRHPARFALRHFQPIATAHFGLFSENLGHDGPENVLAPDTGDGEDGGDDPGAENGQLQPGTKVISNFPGITNTGASPADDNLAVSSTEVVEAANEVLAFWNKDGTAVSVNGSNSISLPTLFSGAVFNSVWDPRIVYDPANGGHFIVAALEESSSPEASNLDIAVSTNASPTPSPSSWHIFRASMITNVGGNDCWTDFPGLGFDSQAIYFTGNLFSFANGSWFGAKLATFDKNALETSSFVGGAPVGITPAHSEVISDGGSLQPAVTIGAAPAEYIVESWGSTTLRVHAVTNPLSGSYSRATTFVSVPAYGMSNPGAPQPGTTSLINPNDTRILNAVYQNGYLYAAHTIQNTDGGENKSSARWYQIGMNNWPNGTPALVRAGNINPGVGVATYFPSIAVDPSGDIAVGYNESSAQIYPSIYYTIIAPNGSFSSTLVHSGQTSYAGDRWGDYSGTVADPSSPGLFWTVGMSTLSTGAWGTWWSNSAPPTDHLLVGAPTNVSQNTPFTFTITVQAPSGLTDTAYTGTVHFSSTDGVGILPGDYTFTTADAGVHTFAATFSTVGQQSLTAVDTVTSTITGTQPSITVSGPAASSLVVSGFPIATIAGLPQSFSVLALFANGTIDTSYTGTIHFSSSDVQAGLPADYTFTGADGGAHTFTAALKTAGSQWIKAYDTSSPGVAGLESGIAVAPNAASKVILAGYPSPVGMGTSNNFYVQVRDVYGNLVTNYTGTMHFTSSDPRAVLPADYTFTLADGGTHVFSALFNDTGNEWLRATDMAIGSLVGTQTGINVKRKH